MALLPYFANFPFAYQRKVENQNENWFKGEKNQRNSKSKKKEKKREKYLGVQTVDSSDLFYVFGRVGHRE